MDMEMCAWCDRALANNTIIDLIKYVVVNEPSAARYVLNRKLSILTLNDVLDTNITQMISMCFSKMKSVQFISGFCTKSLLSGLFWYTCESHNPYAFRMFLTNFTVDELFEFQSLWTWNSAQYSIMISYYNIDDSDHVKHKAKLFNRMTTFAGFTYNYKRECDSDIWCNSCERHEIICVNAKKAKSIITSAVITILGLYKVRCRHNLQKDTLRIIAKCMWKKRYVVDVTDTDTVNTDTVNTDTDTVNTT